MIDFQFIIMQTGRYVNELARLLDWCSQGFAELRASSGLSSKGCLKNAESNVPQLPDSSTPPLNWGGEGQQPKAGDRN